VLLLLLVEDVELPLLDVAPPLSTMPELPLLEDDELLAEEAEDEEDDEVLDEDVPLEEDVPPPDDKPEDRPDEDGWPEEDASAKRPSTSPLTPPHASPAVTKANASENPIASTDGVRMIPLRPYSTYPVDARYASLRTWPERLSPGIRAGRIARHRRPSRLGRRCRLNFVVRS
jgi:hypothetical protein